MGRDELVDVVVQAVPDLSDDERNLLCSIVLGKDFRPAAGEADVRPTIRSKVLSCLCTSSDVRKLVTARGIRIFGASISGELDLQYVDCGFPLIFEHCVFNTHINLGSGLVDHSQKMTVAARVTAAKKAVGQRS